MNKEQSLISKGLEDVVVADSAICLIDGKSSKLFFRGYDIHELAVKSNFEETAFLLLFGRLPKIDELQIFNAELAAERSIPDEVIRVAQMLPKNGHPMGALRTLTSVLGMMDPEADDKSPESNVRKAKRLLARTPIIVAQFDRLRKGQPVVAPKKDAKVSTAANFLYMLKGSDATPLESQMLDRYFVLLAEHDFNASTFAARVTASTTSDIYSAIVSAIGTLKGDLHGSANSRAMESLIEIGDVNRVESYVEEALKNKRKLMGFGHRVYKGPDPRADVLRDMAKALADGNSEQAKWFAISEKLAKAVWDRKKLYCNVDFYSASVLYTIGIAVDLFTAMFAISRMAGWTAHVLEQNADNRIIRPLTFYTGKSDLSYQPIERR